MKIALIILFLCFGLQSVAQEKKLAKLFAKDYKRVDAIKSYPFNETNSHVTIVPSNTYVGDTSGIVYNNSFVNFRFNRMKLPDEQTYYHSSFDSVTRIITLTPYDTVVPPLQLIRYVKEQPVSVTEFLEFQHWVRDSTARDLIYLNETFLSDKEAIKLVQVDTNSVDWGPDLWFDISDRQLNRELFPLNWKYKLEYNNYNLEALESLYIPSEETFCRKLEFDQRKFNYAYTELAQLKLPTNDTARGYKNRMRYFVKYETPTLVDTYSWMNLAPRRDPSVDHSLMNRKELEVLSQLYLQQFPNSPIIGITGMQARAYCDWKEKQIRAVINTAELPFNVEISIISAEDLSMVNTVDSFIIPSYNPTENWRITVAEYEDFIEAVRDSLLNDCLYATISDPKDVIQLVNYQKQYPKESISDVAYLYYSQENKELNRIVFPLTYNKSILQKYPTLVDSIRQSETYKNPYFAFMYMNEYERSLTGALAPFRDENWLETVYTDTSSYGKDYNMGYENDRHQSSGVRSHKNLATLYTTEIISVLPEIDIDSQQKDTSVQGITYGQALAFYAWKYPIHKATAKDNWLQYVLPTREEFECVQRGEKISVQAKKIAYPTPTFRYVIHLIPLEDEE